MRRLVSLVVFASCVSVAGAQISGGFEACAPGPVPPAGCGPASWITVPGGSSGLVTVFAEPGGAGIPGPVGGFPTSGVQWGIVSAVNGGGFLTSPAPGGPAPYPLAPGSTGNLVFAGVTVGGTISFDWSYVSPECPNDPQYNDFLSVDVVDAGTGMPLANVLYRDTFSGTYGAAVSPEPQTGVVAAGFCPPSLEEAPEGAAKSLIFSVPAALVGTVVNVEFHVGNATDNNFGGYLYLDDIQIAGTPGLAVQLSSPLGAGSIRVDNFGLTAGNGYYNFLTLNEPCPGGPGTGPYAGLCTADINSLLAQLMLPVPSPPFSFVAAGSSYTFVPLVVPFLSGATLEIVCFDPSAAAFSGVHRHTVP